MKQTVQQHPVHAGAMKQIPISFRKRYSEWFFPWVTQPKRPVHRTALLKFARQKVIR